MFLIWDKESENLLGSYRTEEAALSVVRETAEAHGVDAVSELVILYEDEPRGLRTVAEGQEILEYGTLPLGLVAG